MTCYDIYAILCSGAAPAPPAAAALEAILQPHGLLRVCDLSWSLLLGMLILQQVWSR